MKNLINIIISKERQYKVCKWFKKRVPHLSNYLIKTIGVNHDDNKHEPHKKVKEGKRPSRYIKHAAYHHLLHELKSA